MVFKFKKFNPIIENQWIIFILLGILSFYYTGYKFGGHDNVNILIPVKQFQDSSFLSNDFTFSNSNDIGRIFFIKLIAYFSSFLPMESLFFLLFISTRILLCAGLYKFAHALTNNKGISYLTIFAIFYLFKQNIPLADKHLISTQFYTPYFAISLVFFALAFFIRKKYFSSFFLIGIITNIHIIVGTQIFGILFIYLLIHWKKIHLKTILKSILIFFFISSPELINTFKISLTLSASSNISTKEYIEIIGKIRTPHHFIPTYWSIEQFLRFFIFMLCGTYAYITGTRTPEKITGIQICLIISAIIFISSPLIYYSPAIMLYHPYRMTQWFYPIMLILMIEFFIKSFGSNSKFSKIWGILCLVFLNSPYVIAFLFFIRVLIDYRSQKSNDKILYFFLFYFSLVILKFIPLRYNIFNISSIFYETSYPIQVVQFYLFVGVLLFCFLVIFQHKDLKKFKSLNLILFLLTAGLFSITILNFTKTFQFPLITRFQPTIKKATNNVDFIDLCSWIKTQTKKNDLIIVPPRMKGFRYYAERPILANFKFYPLPKNKAKEWYKRLDLISKGYLTQYKGLILGRKTYLDKPHPVFVLENGYSHLTAHDVKKIAKRYNVKYIVTKPGHQLALKIVYRNSKYNVFQI